MVPEARRELQKEDNEMNLQTVASSQKMVLLAKALPWLRHSLTHMVWVDEGWFPEDK